jgi:MATE family multidrug resistance protein
MFQYLENWRKKSRYRDVSRVCLPLVAGMAATTVMEFTDRIFLSHYSVDAISAVVPAGVSVFLLLVFFGGIAAYISVFIAQYSGAGRWEKIGSTLWQGIFFTLFSGIIFFAIAAFMTKPLFALVGHGANIQVLEVQYFSILCQGGILHVAIQTLSGFFTGRGLTRPVMIANILGMLVNVPLNYALIYGAWGAPELGIVGAAIATVVAWGVTALCLAPLVFSKHFQREFKLMECIAVDWSILKKLFKYGVPGALQFSMDVFAFTFFILIIGRLGTMPLAASNIVISISSLAFMPALAFSFGISSMAGHALGCGKPEEARAAAWSGIHILMCYTLVLGGCFIFFSKAIVALFIDTEAAGVNYEELLSMASILLKFVATYIVFDVFYMIFAAVLKGAGDTRFLLLAICGATFFLMLLPLSIGINYLGMSVYMAWGCVVLFIGSLALMTSLRYRGGKWEKMLVIGG